MCRRTSVADKKFDTNTGGHMPGDLIITDLSVQFVVRSEGNLAETKDAY